MTAAMSSAERQKKYREKAAESALVRLQVVLEPGAAENLDFIQAETGLNKRQSVELAINQCAEALKKEAPEGKP